MSNITNIQHLGQQIKENIGRVILGCEAAVELLLVALLAEGHVLLEDVPGTGKTTLAKSLARSLDCSFSRVQFTPDLLPSDVTGIYFFNQKSGEFQYRPGPVQANIVLADEINRAGPRTQSALLEAMQESQVTVEGETRALPRPFLVIATQNPIELEGTFPLPEAQIDRFLMRLSLGYLSRDEEMRLLRRYQAARPLDTLEAVITADTILTVQQQAQQLFVHDVIAGYMVDIARASRNHAGLALGISARGTLALYHASQALAALRGRSYVLPDDVKHLAQPVLGHRLIASAQTRLRAQTADDILRDILSRVPVPVEERFGPDGIEPATSPSTDSEPALSLPKGPA